MTHLCLCSRIKKPTKKNSFNSSDDDGGKRDEHITENIFLSTVQISDILYNVFMTWYKVCNNFTSIYRASEQLSKLQEERKQLSKQLKEKETKLQGNDHFSC